MTPQTWVAIIGVMMQFVVLVLAAGIYFGRQETKGTRKTDDNGTYVMRASRPDVKDLTEQMTRLVRDLTEQVVRLEARLTKYEQEWRDNREAWHDKFEGLEQARFGWLKDADQLYVRRETSQANFEGVWMAIKSLRQHNDHDVSVRDRA